MSDLVLPLKREYFEQIKAGEKWFEYRLCNDYWRKRLDEHDAYDRIILTLGYPRRDDSERRLTRPWRGYTTATIIHPHFGPNPVEVYVIDVRPE
ncbi:ASCH domain-containing protein (plasmid) [Delftia tsuruhatensis]